MKIRITKDQIIKYSKYGLLVAGVVILLSVISVWMVNTIMGKVIHNRREVIVPDITGKTINEALTILSDKRLSLEKVADKYDIDIPAGSIISQSPPPGLTVREGKSIEAVISSGGQVVFIPEIEGKSLRQAELLLRQAGLLIGEQTRTYNSTVKRDYVVSQDPSSGEIVEKNSYVNIVVSKGPAEEEKIMKMPNILGKLIQSAEMELKEFDLEVDRVKTMVNDELNEGTVVGQIPGQGEIINKNTRVEIVISKLSKSVKEVRDEMVYYEVIQSGRQKSIKIIIEDDIGERTVYNSLHEGGDKIELPVKLLGDAVMKVFVDEVLTKEDIIKVISDEQIEENEEEK